MLENGSPFLSSWSDQIDLAGNVQASAVDGMVNDFVEKCLVREGCQPPRLVQNAGSWTLRLVTSLRGEWTWARHFNAVVRGMLGKEY